MIEERDTLETPTRVCRHCSTQSVTAGEFCPHCGKSFVRRRRFRRRTAIAGAIMAALLVLGGSGTAIALKQHSDHVAQVARDRRAAQVAEAARKRRAAAAAAARERQRQKDAQGALDKIELAGRTDLEHDLQKAITKDAREKVSIGLLDGPILHTTCDPVGGGRDDLTSRTGKYECLAVTKVGSDGTSTGYSFHATINYKEFSYTWGLGRD
jgi:hypothetical protein